MRTKSHHGASRSAGAAFPRWRLFRSARRRLRYIKTFCPVSVFPLRYCADKISAYLRSAGSEVTSGAVSARRDDGVALHGGGASEVTRRGVGGQRVSGRSRSKVTHMKLLIICFVSSELLELAKLMKEQ
ncbi:hypothetical protein EYF80_055238 [Liparis tanakae]|uniref:Uncharacterized protein n=1 Tax=Liparis tanakae TaxID=230148 RepID=A0A4Z2F058_9TELE|nr:hypothetical protein EYF80_055238 [Liparis tanakae]